MKTIKTKVQQLKAYLVKRLMAKEVVALKLNKFKLPLDNKVSSTSISVLMLPTRVFACVYVHYVGGGLDSMSYDDVEMAHQDYNFITDLFLKENANLKQKRA